MSTDLTQGKVSWQLCRMAGPMMIGIFSIMSMYFADSYYIAQLGVRPLAAVGFVLPMINVLSALGFGFGSGASSLIARAYGRQDKEGLVIFATHALIAAFIHACFLSVLGYFFAENIFQMMGAKGLLLDEVMAYANVWLYGCVLVIIPMVGNSIIRATGNTKFPSIVMLSIAFVNIILDPVFIFGLGPIPAMGIQGAAIATLVAYSVAFFLALYMLRFHLRLIKFNALRTNAWAIWKPLLHIAYPSILTNMMVPLSVAVTTAFIAVYGEAAIAGYSVAMRIESFALVPVFGLASVMGPFVGQNMGAGQKQRMDEALSWSTKAMLLYGGFVYVVILLFGENIVSVFDTSLEVEAQAFHYLSLVAWSYGLLGITVVTNSCANALARPMIAVVINLGRLFFIYMPLLLILQTLSGIAGVYLAISLSILLIAGIALYLRRFYVAK